MINSNLTQLAQSTVRKIGAKVELYNGSALAASFGSTDKLVEFKVERVAEEGKFFGFGVCQHMELTILDKAREVEYINTGYSFTPLFEEVKTAPLFYVTQTRRNENNNNLTIYGYDVLNNASKLYSSELILELPYTVLDVAEAIAAAIGASGVIIERMGANERSFYTVYEEGANLEGTETLRELLNSIAEVTQTIYYINSGNQLVFKRLNKDAAADLVITKNDYITLECRDGRRLSAITHATQLGDNVTASSAFSGSTQYVRDNPFWDMREDINELVEAALAAVEGLSIRQFTCSWRGNPCLEMGDKIELITKDGAAVASFILDDVISYTGALEQSTQWSYEEEEPSAANPSSLGEVLNQTFAKVDKANKQVEIVASEVGNFEGRISILEMDTESINAAVSNVEKATTERLNDIGEDISVINNRVNASMTAEQVEIAINKAVDNGVSNVETSTGFTFNDKGLTVAKSNSEIKTTITEDGMRVEKENDIVLTANNEGVKAIDLHAETFLIIGTNSRFENYGGSRTGCFWIGGR